MNRLTLTSFVLIILNSLISSALANVKITPIAVENKSNLKLSDLKVEEARYRDPVMPEYYGNDYDRNRQNFVTGSNYGSYGGGMSSYDRYGSGMGGDRYGSGLNGDRYGSTYGSGSGYDRYGGAGGSQWNRDRTGVNYGSNPMDKVGYMPGGVYNGLGGGSSGLGFGGGSSGLGLGGSSGLGFGGSSGLGLSGSSGLGLGGSSVLGLGGLGSKNGPYGGSTYGGNSYGGNSYGNRNPYEGGSINGPYPGAGGMFQGAGAGLFSGGDPDGKSSLILPLAGAALLGIAAYALVSNPAIAMGTMGAMGPGSFGKRRKRSLFDDKLEQHLVYRAHQRANKKNIN